MSHRYVRVVALNLPLCLAAVVLPCRCFKTGAVCASSNLNAAVQHRDSWQSEISSRALHALIHTMCAQALSFELQCGTHTYPNTALSQRARGMYLLRPFITCEGSSVSYINDSKRFLQDFQQPPSLQGRSGGFYRLASRISTHPRRCSSYSGRLKSASWSPSPIAMPFIKATRVWLERAR